MSLQETSPGVFYGTSRPITVGPSELTFLQQEARNNEKRRARICAHSDVSDIVHEMVICLLRDGYVQPHAHRTSESLHVIEGSCDLVLFDTAGKITQIVPLGCFEKETRIIRMEPEVFHTLVIRSEHFIFHETAQGPFRKEHTRYADWAPAESQTEPLRRYFRALDASISELRKNDIGS
ncbi:MAG: WbuC family cupin fold metalloprotein [Planctomycetota bacterium]|nr:WbuC family cupin fold metalloprotein [Planctomycetota bacterium]